MARAGSRASARPVGRPFAEAGDQRPECGRRVVEIGAVLAAANTARDRRIEVKEGSRPQPACPPVRARRRTCPSSCAISSRIGAAGPSGVRRSCLHAGACRCALPASGLDLDGFARRQLVTRPLRGSRSARPFRSERRRSGPTRGSSRRPAPRPRPSRSRDRGRAPCGCRCRGSNVSAGSAASSDLQPSLAHVAEARVVVAALGVVVVRDDGGAQAGRGTRGDRALRASAGPRRPCRSRRPGWSRRRASAPPRSPSSARPRSRACRRAPPGSVRRSTA